MNDFATIQCPHCGENFELALDVSEGSGEFIVDCEVCCRPMTVTVLISAGEVGDVRVTAA